MNKRLLSVMVFLAIGIGITSDAMAKVGSLVVRERSRANAEFILENETIVNVPVNIIFDEAENEDEIGEVEAENESEELAKEINDDGQGVEADGLESLATEEMGTFSEPEPEPEPEPAPAPVYVEPNNIKITGRELLIVDVADTGVDAGDHVNRYGLRFLYGHNSAAVFGDLKNVGEGATFSVTIDGVTRQYRVMKTVIFEKNVETGRIEIGGESKYKGKDYMNAVANARFRERQYDLSIMTCYGTPYANRDASHRYVIFADEI